MNPFPALARQFLNVPLAFRKEAADMLLDDLVGAGRQTQALVAPDMEQEQPRAYDVVQGVAIVPVQGVLVKNSDWISDYFGMSGYDTIGDCTVDAVSDPEIKAVVLHINSPGGPCSGVFDLADLIFSLRGTKPIWAILDDGAYSAAYAIASAADRIIAPRAGGVGSIGVMQICVDISEMLKEAGIAVEMLHFGDAKADGYPYAPMTAGARGRMQGGVDQLGEMFVELVAKHRTISPKAVRDTQAECLFAADAVTAGLIDAVGTPAEAFGALLASLS